MNKLLPMLFLTLLAIALACTSGLTRSVAAQRATHETTQVYTTPDGFLLGDVVPGSSATLQRNRNGLTTNVHTSVEASGAYTVWWVLFNHPSSCVTFLCTFDEPDLVVNATGHLVPVGNANFSGRLIPGGPYSGEVLFEGPEPELTNPAGALIVLVIRYHGPAIPGMINEQLTTFLGGCPDGGAPCQDVQLVVFPGPECTGACATP
jgi:hypothetical protein